MKITFVSNYINHHQIPFSNEMVKLCGENGSYTFIQTEKMDEERIRMGWGTNLPDYVRLAYTDEAENVYCRQLIMDSDAVIFGGCEDESYIAPRLEAGKLTFRYSERLYKEAQWKWISPRGLIKKRHDHTRFNKMPVYLLCSGAYVASDFGKFGAYKNKMYKWGYFPAIHEYDIDRIIDEKGWTDELGNKVPYFLWTGRFLDWKHPELAVEVARFLRDRKYHFHMDIIGNGPEYENVMALYRKYELHDFVTIRDFMKPDEVREYMKKADVQLFTSDRNEGWGAVANEAMNSGCAVIADHMIGAVPYLMENGINGCVYDDRSLDELFKWAEEMADNPELRHYIGKRAYETVTEIWNPKNAAESLYELILEKMKENGIEIAESDLYAGADIDLYVGADIGKRDRNPFYFAPCMREYPKSETRIREELFGRKKPVLPHNYT